MTFFLGCMVVAPLLQIPSTIRNASKRVPAIFVFVVDGGTQERGAGRRGGRTDADHWRKNRIRTSSDRETLCGVRSVGGKEGEGERSQA